MPPMAITALRIRPKMSSPFDGALMTFSYVGSLVKSGRR